MKRTKLIVISICIASVFSNLHAQVPDPLISFSFDQDAAEGETITNDQGGITGDLMGHAYCSEGDLVLEQTEDTVTDYVDLDAASIDIAGFSELSVLISFTSDTLDYGGVTTQHIGIWAFGDIYDYNGGLGVDYLYFAPSRQGEDNAQALIACGYGAYCFEHQDSSGIYEPNLMDDTRHEAVVTFDNHQLGLFVDGNLAGYGEVNSDTNNIESLSTFYAFIGRSMYGTNFVSEFKGRVHDFRIYDVALSADDVEAIYKNTGIPAKEKKPDPRVYSTGSAVIVDLTGIQSKETSINIFDLTGKLVRKLVNNGSREEIFLSSGTYLVQVRIGKHYHTEKVIIFQ